MRTANPTRQYLRYFLWLLMTINLLQAGGYILFSGLGNIGDWAYVIHDLEPVWLWRLWATQMRESWLFNAGRLADLYSAFWRSENSAAVGRPKAEKNFSATGWR